MATTHEQTARWEFYRDHKKEWRFRFVAANGEIMAQSEGYKNLSDCLMAIDVIEGAIRGVTMSGDLAGLPRNEVTWL
jgi:uncharacterized protein YegP (UPF0339 family)